MKNRLHQLRNERGMVLFTSLTILSVLLIVGLGSRVMLHNDFKVLTNLRGSTETFYVSAAGLEWSKKEISQRTDFPPAPANRSQGFAAGVFSVSFDPPEVISPLAAKIVVRSVGTMGLAAAHTLKAQLTKNYDLADAAMVLRGNASRVNFSGTTLRVSGLDHDPVSGSPIQGAKARAAVSTSDSALAGLVEAAAATLPAGSFDGGADGAVIAPSAFLPAGTIGQLANTLCNLATAISGAVPPTGSLIYENQVWGSRDAPQLRCVDGLLGVGDGVTLAGNISGAGILIIKNAELILNGAFRWEGLIIVTGSDVSLRVAGAGNKDILGAIIVNEAGSPDSNTPIVDIQGSLNLLYSRGALNQTTALLSVGSLTNIYASLPWTITQNYWRIVSQ